MTSLPTSLSAKSSTLKGMNRLAQETSPYLRQHAENPVDWYPWGDEAFAAARARDVPLLLSVGYSTCHWCHVMAHESFENEQVAAFMNEHFVNVKIDREERPDVDGVYMSAVQAMTGSGGWPMTVFALPSGEPFYAGTYFPPRDMRGMPSFSRLLEQHRLHLAHRAPETARQRGGHHRPPARASAGKSGRGAGRAGESRPCRTTFWPAASTTSRRVYDRPARRLRPRAQVPRADHAELFADAAAGPLRWRWRRLRQMGRGGIYDQLGGGFHRYSVDERWLVPHFEKMLYDNAQLARTLLQAFQVSQDPAFLRLARDTLGYLEREMLDAGGGFYSAQDADQNGIEGQFFVWTPPELAAVLGEDAGWISRYFGVTEHGNFQDPHHPEFGRRSVLSVQADLSTLAAELGRGEADLQDGTPTSPGHALFRAHQAHAPPAPTTRS